MQTAIKPSVTQTTFAAMRLALLSSVMCCCSNKSFAGDGVTSTDGSIFCKVGCIVSGVDRMHSRGSGFKDL